MPSSYVKDYVMDPNPSTHLFVDEKLAADSEQKALAQNFNAAREAEIVAEAFEAFGNLARCLKLLDTLNKMRTGESFGFDGLLLEFSNRMNQKIFK